MASVATMDFFENQDIARKKTSILIGYYIIAVILIMAAIYFAFAATFIGVGARMNGEVNFGRLWNPDLFLWVIGGTLLIVLMGTVYKVSQLSGGGRSVAEILGGRPIGQGTTDPDEKKVLNVVEEMAIASGTSVPPVYLLDGEAGINAFAAGFSPEDAVIGVTRGCITELSRDELQGVIAHEFSHILNGDMRLNIRLMGVLHGILVIGLLGYWIFRSALYSRGSRSKDQGNKLPIVALGLVVMIIGYVGVLFGKIIKSAVSRQREFLADASAVQFTRNPDGIGGALKKIAGYAHGSKLANAHAEEASHLFFSNGLTASFSNLMATHPSLEERIRRIDPKFDKSTHSDRNGGVHGNKALVSGFASGSDINVNPKSVVAGVGAPRVEHLDYASRLLDNLPRVLLNATRDPYGARAVVYCLILSSDRGVRNAQLDRLSKHADKGVLTETRKLVAYVESVRREGRLPLLDMAISALRDLSPSQYSDFKANVEHLVHADNEIDLFEFTLQHIIKRHLDPMFYGKHTRSTKHNSIASLVKECRSLLSCLAYWGSDDNVMAEKAFARGMAELGLDENPGIVSSDQCGLELLAAALEKLTEAAPRIKKLLLTACISCVALDEKISIEEAEALRAISDSLGCPMPPFLPGQALAA
ncbi:MAG: M48 family metallopeptidase [Lentisphaerae bacterium]|nr:M48 family metallopeptidase [Lentisphaerota bacterium]